MPQNCVNRHPSLGIALLYRGTNVRCTDIHSVRNPPHVTPSCGKVLAPNPLTYHPMLALTHVRSGAKLITLSLGFAASSTFGITPQTWFQTGFQGGGSPTLRIDQRIDYINKNNEPVISSWAEDLYGADTISLSNWQSSMEHFGPLVEQSDGTKVDVEVAGARKLSVTSGSSTYDAWIGRAYLNGARRSGQPRYNYASIVDNPNSAAGSGNTSSRVMRFRVAKAVEEFYLDAERTVLDTKKSKGRVQLELQKNKNWKEFHYELDVYFPSAVFNKIKNNLVGTWGNNGAWFNLGEFNHQNRTTSSSPAEYPSRIGLNLRIDDDKNWRFTCNFEARPTQGQQWNQTSTAPVPLDQWFKLYVYIKEGNYANQANPGRFRVAIKRATDASPRVLFNITGPTYNGTNIASTNRNEGYTGFSAIKVYTNYRVIQAATTGGGALDVYFDNYKLIYGTPSTTSGTPAWALLGTASIVNK